MTILLACTMTLVSSAPNADGGAVWTLEPCGAFVLAFVVVTLIGLAR